MQEIHIRIFSGPTAAFLCLVLGGSLLFATVRLLRSEPGVERWIVGAVLCVLLVAAAHVATYAGAKFEVTNSSVRYSRGFMNRILRFEEIRSVALLPRVPEVRYKLWAYALAGEMNGAFRMASGRTGYIAGGNGPFLAVTGDAFDLYMQMPDTAVSEAMLEEIRRRLPAPSGGPGS